MWKFCFVSQHPILQSSWDPLLDQECEGGEAARLCDFDFSSAMCTLDHSSYTSVFYLCLCLWFNVLYAGYSGRNAQGHRERTSCLNHPISGDSQWAPGCICSTISALLPSHLPVFLNSFSFRSFNEWVSKRGFCVSQGVLIWIIDVQLVTSRERSSGPLNAAMFLMSLLLFNINLVD